MERLPTRFARNEKGTINVLFGLMAIPMMGIVGASIDAAQAISAEMRLQALVDQAAIAGARLPATTDDRRLAAAEEFYKANLDNARLSGATHEITANNADVRVAASYNYPTAIIKLIGFNEIPLDAVASARPQIDNGGLACILALNETMSDAFHLQGINEANSRNCWVWVNSSSGAAISATGAAVATAQGFCTYGGIDGSDHFGPRPYSGCDRLADPFYEKFKSYQPSSTFCDHENFEAKSGTYTLNPGVYCGDTLLRPNADVTLSPGVYVMKNGSLTVQAGSTLRGKDVTIFFVGTNTFLDVRGGASVDLKAPATGDLAGFLLVDRKYDLYDPNIYETTIQGGGYLKFEGVMYAPQWRVTISGNSELNQDSKCFAMVADHFHMEGNGKLNVIASCEETELPQIMPKIKYGPTMME